MLFRIDPAESAPIYRQIVRQVRDAVASGKLRLGDKLPSQRELAKDLVINHLTVKQAYDVLEADGIIATERGRGTFVAHEAPSDLLEDGLDDLRARTRELAVAARLLGMRRGDLIALLRDVWQADEAPASASERKK